MVNTVRVKQETTESLHNELRRLLVAALDGSDEIVNIEVVPCPYTSFYACSIVTAALSNRDELQLFWKDYGTFPRDKEGLPERRERELLVYRDLLAGADLDTAKYYGSTWDDRIGRYWLFLEFVDGMPVRYCDIEYWFAAARWLARLQSHFAPLMDQLDKCRFLITYDAAGFEPAARNAFDAMAKRCPNLANRIKPVVNSYGKLAEIMTDEPRSFVHGAFRAGQILLQNNNATPRLCTVDWELAGVGSSLFDLAELTYGFKPTMRDEFIDAFQYELEGHGVATLDEDEMRLRIDCFHLHRVMKQLSKAHRREFAKKDIEYLIDTATRLAKRLL